ncbi:GNAT family N-acetyltransferase [Acinetobacter sp. 1207_04]|uniref:GNAT family N-acetyltransferase n=1 Tax=Acinetobacter sp. 1207_04 TaxID=2604449 RepID=UPI00405907C1
MIELIKLPSIPISTSTKQLIELETERLKLRAWQESDLQPFAELNADKDVMHYFPSVLTREQSDNLADKFQHLILDHGWGFWAVELKVTGQFIGFTGLNIQPEQFIFSPCVEIGWRFAKQYWHQGYATEAAKACLKFAFETLQLKEVVSFTAVHNTASEHVMQRLGMQAMFEFNHPALTQESPLSRHILYKIVQKSL